LRGNAPNDSSPVESRPGRAKAKSRAADRPMMTDASVRTALTRQRPLGLLRLPTPRHALLHLVGVPLGQGDVPAEVSGRRGSGTEGHAPKRPGAVPARAHRQHFGLVIGIFEQDPPCRSQSAGTGGIPPPSRRATTRPRPGAPNNPLARPPRRTPGPGAADAALDGRNRVCRQAIRELSRAEES